MLMKIIERKFVIDRGEDENTANKSDGHPHDVDDSMRFMLQHISPSNFDVVFKHKFLISSCNGKEKLSGKLLKVFQYQNC